MTSELFRSNAYAQLPSFNNRNQTMRTIASETLGRSLAYDHVAEKAGQLSLYCELPGSVQAFQRDVRTKQIDEARLK